jgi:hypothetical protein
MRSLNSTLQKQKIALGGNQIGDKGGKYLAYEIKVNSTLHRKLISREMKLELISLLKSKKC